MASGFMSVQIIGHLGADPELRYTSEGSAVASASIAYTESWKNKATGQKEERTEWVKLTFFGKVAEIAGEYLKKGSQCFVEGKLRTEKWTDKDGIERYTTKVVVNQLRLLGGRPEGGQRSAPSNTGGGERGSRSDSMRPQRASQQQHDFEDDDIPF